MPHTVTEMDNGSYKNMVSNLPLLFAGGYPTSLDRITESQLEKFIPFMVQCSLGYIHIPSLEEYSEPEWWPGDLEFIIPFCRPKLFRGNWLEKMRELVVICYSFHKCVFLLRFCTDLASYEPATLRFINNYNSTTSLYQRHTRKLLVTFRNENMLYDQTQQASGRKCLLPKQTNSQQSDLQHEQMVEPAFFDIYLCDDCDAELYSYDAYVEHEKVCLNRKVVEEDSEDDDVIFCGSEVLPTPKRSDEQIPVYAVQNMSSFLMNFSLSNKHNPLALRKIGSNVSTSEPQHINILDGSPEKIRRLPRRTRGILTLSKCTSIPLSSPCGRFLLKSSKTIMSIDYQMERLERLERFCFAPALRKNGPLIINRPKWLNSSRLNTNVSVSYKRGSDELEHYHCYKFPRRQLSSACKIRNFQFYNKLLINKCKPCAIKLQRLTAQEIENRNIDIRLQHLNISRACASFDVLAGELNKAIHVVVDCIDLCSSDEDESGVSINQNGCIISMEASDVGKLADPTQKRLSSVIDRTLFKSASDVNSLHTFSKKTVGHCTFQPLTPSLHLFSSAHNVNPATTSSHAQQSSTNNLLQSSLCVSEETHDNTVILSNMENLTEVKENRVNDWLNDATENLTHVPQSHLVMTTATPIMKNSNGMAVSKTLPSLKKVARPSSPSSKDFIIRKRTATTIELS